MHIKILLKRFVLSFLIMSMVISLSTGCNNNILSRYENELSNRFETEIDKYAESDNFNGNILVARDGKILFEKSYGYANFEEKVLNASDTRFLIGSITKQFTSMLIMQLQESGLLNVNDTVEKYVPGFIHGDKITIHHLLTHTSGLPREIEGKDYPVDSIPTNLEEAVEYAKKIKIPLLFASGESYSYSNAGYILLGYIIEKVSGMPYKDILHDNILKPLKMNNSGFGYDRRNDEKLALGYDDKQNCITTNEFIDMSMWPHAAGSIFSTVEDLYKWDRALYSNKLVDKKSMEKIFTPYKRNYAYGWVINSEPGRKVYWHNGLVYGFSSSITRYVDEDTCIIALSNRSNFQQTDQSILERIINSIFMPE